MAGFHSTFWKKIASVLFETNAFNPVEWKVNTDFQPVINVEPEIIVFTSDFTTKTNADFFVTNIGGACVGDGVNPGSANIILTVANGTTQTFLCQTGVADSNSISILFPKQGLKLKRGTNQQIGLASASDSAFIAGYYGSDRV